MLIKVWGIKSCKDAQTFGGGGGRGWGGLKGLTVCLIDSGQCRHVSAVNVMNGDGGGALTSV